MSNGNGTQVAGVRLVRLCAKGLLALMLLLVAAGHGLAQSAPYRVLRQWPGGDTTRQRRDYTFNYKTWDNMNWSARLEGNGFVHAPNGDWSRAHRDTIIKYVSWGGSLWTAQVGGNEFVHAPNGDWSRSHRDTIINYMDWGGTAWTARLEEKAFVHAPAGDWSRAHKDSIIAYRTWGGAPWTARLEGNEFIHAPNGDWSQAHRDSIINYETWGGEQWTAQVEGTAFVHTRRSDSSTHKDTIIAYETWDRRPWTARIAEPSNPGLNGEWSNPSRLNVLAVHTSVLPDGNLLLWSRRERPRDVAADPALPGGYLQVRKWNPGNRTFLDVPLPPGSPAPDLPFGQGTNVNDLFCSGHSFLPDGRLLITGGHFDNFKGTTYANRFNYRHAYEANTAAWNFAAPMAEGRWYPTNCPLGNGETLVLGGVKLNEDDSNITPEVYGADGSHRALSGARATTPPIFNAWYPWLYLAPDGRVLHAGPDVKTHYLSTAGNGGWDLANGFSHLLANSREYGASVLYDEGKVLVVGGGSIFQDGNAPTDTAEVTDMKQKPSAWLGVNPMIHRRRFHNATLLPDGTVLVIGGTGGGGGTGNLGTGYPGLYDLDRLNAVATAELWNPKDGAPVSEGSNIRKGSWTLLGSMTSPRLYHSVAVLLPDGRVFVAGGGQGLTSAADYSDGEFYSPPYLFKGSRPIIASATAEVAYGGAITVNLGSAANISDVVLIRLPSTTHSVNMNQSFSRLPFRISSDRMSLVATAPASGNTCPPGHYMLFVLNDQGVPSVASILRVR
jgi:hypothetical protein